MKIPQSGYLERTDVKRARKNDTQSIKIKNLPDIERHLEEWTEASTGEQKYARGQVARTLLRWADDPSKELDLRHCNPDAVATFPPRIASALFADLSPEFVACPDNLSGAPNWLAECPLLQVLDLGNVQAMYTNLAALKNLRRIECAHEANIEWITVADPGKVTTYGAGIQLLDPSQPFECPTRFSRASLKDWNALSETLRVTIKPIVLHQGDVERLVRALPGLMQYPSVGTWHRDACHVGDLLGPLAKADGAASDRICAVLAQYIEDMARKKPSNPPFLARFAHLLRALGDAHAGPGLANLMKVLAGLIESATTFTQGNVGSAAQALQLNGKCGNVALVMNALAAKIRELSRSNQPVESRCAGMVAWALSDKNPADAEPLAVALIEHVKRYSMRFDDLALTNFAAAAEAMATSQDIASQFANLLADQVRHATQSKKPLDRAPLLHISDACARMGDAAGTEDLLQAMAKHIATLFSTRAPIRGGAIGTLAGNLRAKRDSAATRSMMDALSQQLRMQKVALWPTDVEKILRGLHGMGLSKEAGALMHAVAVHLQKFPEMTAECPAKYVQLLDGLPECPPLNWLKEALCSGKASHSAPSPVSQSTVVKEAGPPEVIGPEAGQATRSTGPRGAPGADLSILGMAAALRQKTGKEAQQIIDRLAVLLEQAAGHESLLDDETIHAIGSSLQGKKNSRESERLMLALAGQIQRRVDMHTPLGDAALEKVMGILSHAADCHAVQTLANVLIGHVEAQENVEWKILRLLSRAFARKTASRNTLRLQEVLTRKIESKQLGISSRITMRLVQDMHERSKQPQDNRDLAALLKDADRALLNVLAEQAPTAPPQRGSEPEILGSCSVLLALEPLLPDAAATRIMEALCRQFELTPVNFNHPHERSLFLSNHLTLDAAIEKQQLDLHGYTHPLAEFAAREIRRRRVHTMQITVGRSNHNPSNDGAMLDAVKRGLGPDYFMKPYINQDRQINPGRIVIERRPLIG